jgi:hypothetical protein
MRAQTTGVRGMGIGVGSNQWSVGGHWGGVTRSDDGYFGGNGRWRVDGYFGGGLTFLGIFGGMVGK